METVPAPVGAFMTKASPEIGERLNAILQGGKAGVDTLLPQLDAAAAKGKIPPIDQQSVDALLQQAIAKSARGGPAVADRTAVLQDAFKTFPSGMGGVNDFSSAEALKRGYQDAALPALAKLAGTRSPVEQAQVQIAGIMRDAVEQQADKAAGAQLTPELSEAWKHAKDMQSKALAFLPQAQGGEARALARNMASPSDKLAAAMGVMSSATKGESQLVGGVKAAVFGFANNQIRRRAASTLAVGAQGTAESLEALVRASPQQFGAQGAVLGTALAKSPEAFNAATYVLGQMAGPVQDYIQGKKGDGTEGMK